ncbi:hypothetical protein KUCAC02_004663, partial [Chaenocephalus aceratus]
MPRKYKRKTDRVSTPLEELERAVKEFAQRNSIDMPASWTRDEKAGPDWFNAFKARYHLACRVPEATSLGRATAFNKHNVGEFFDNLSKVMDRFPPHMMYNMDETGVTTVQTPKQVVTEKGKKQVGSVTSAERGDGWMNEDAFLIFLKHFIRHTNCSTDHPVLLILDNHESHISLKSVTIAKEKGVIMLTLPPHTSHRLQPLDKTVYGPLKTYNRAMDGWMRSNPGDIFPEEDYAPSMVTDRANPEDEPSATADLPGEEPSTSAAAHLPGPSHEPTHVTADPDPGEPPATLTNPEHLS